MSMIDLVQGSCLIDEHNRYIILDVIDQPAVMADKLLFFFAIFKLPAASRIPHALRAGKNFQQFLFKRHILLLSFVQATP